LADPPPDPNAVAGAPTPATTPAPEASPSPEAAPPVAAAPPTAASPAHEADLGRRRFFRAFAGELIQTAATMAGAAQALQRASAEAASAILDPAGTGGFLGTPGGAEAPGPPASLGPTGFRTPFREDAGVLYLIDQRRLPDALVEYSCKSAGEVAYAIREMVVRGAPAIGRSPRSGWP